MEKKNTDFIDFRALYEEYKSKWYLFLISIVACMVLAVLFIKVRKPTYGVRANVLIQIDDTNPLSSLGAMGSLFGSSGRVDDEIYVISSHSLYRDVVKALGTNQYHGVRYGFLNTQQAYPNPPLWVTAAPGVADTLNAVINFKVTVDEDGSTDVVAKYSRRTLAEVKDQKLPVTVKTEYGDFTISPTQAFVPGEKLKDKIRFAGYHAAAEMLAKDISSEVASKKSNAIELGINTKNVEYGIDVLNTIITEYNKRGIAEKNLQGEQTAKFINERLAIINEGLNESEANLQKYKESNKIIDVSTEAKYQFAVRGEVESQLLAAETNDEIIKMVRDFLRNPDNAYSLVPASLDNESLAAAIGEYNTLVLQRMEMAVSATPGNQALVQLSERIDAMRKNILESVERAYQSSQITLRELRGAKSQVSGKLDNIPTQEREYLELLRQQKVKQNLYTFLLQKGEETAMLLANAVPKGIIVDEAYRMNEPLGLKPVIILILAFFVALCIPPVYLYLKRLLRDKFETRSEAEQLLEAPVLGEVCYNKSGNNLVVSPTSTSSITELFRLLRTNLQFVLNGKDDKVVLVTSTRGGEGKTFVSVNMAASLALLQGKRVVLLGMDIRKPKLAEYLKLPFSPGLTQYLVGAEQSLENIIHPLPGIKDLDVIVAGPIPPNPSEILASDKVETLIDELRSRYDYIIIDSAPVGMVSDSFTLNRVADAVVYITRTNYSTLSDLRFINDAYLKNRLNKLSVIINGTQTRQGYGYGYGERHN